MNRLDNITVKVVSGEHDSPSAAFTLPILSEITAMLEVLSDSGKTGSIDLHHEPLSPDDRARLKEILGVGEVNATLDCLGSTRIQETAISGVWWITHFNKDEKLQGEFIEVTSCPEILITDADELRAGQRLLQTRVSQLSHVPDRGYINKSLQALGLSCSAISQTDSELNHSVNRGNSNAE